MGGGSRARAMGSLYEKDPHVQELTADTFPSGPKESLVWLLEFYSPGCGHCQQLAPKYKQVAASLKGIAHVGAINCDEQRQLCSQHSIQGYPTIKAIVPGKSEGKVYAGERSAKAMHDWVLGLVPNQVMNVKTVSDLGKLLGTCSGAKGKSKGAERAAWDVCVLLFTPKSKTPASYKALSSAFKGKVTLGEVRLPGAKAVAEKMDVPADSQLPTVMALCNGDLKLAQPFNGELKGEALRKFIAEFEGGRKCSQAIRLDESTDLNALTPKMLKQLVKDHAVDCKGAMEKADFITCLQQHISKSSGASAGSAKPAPEEL